MSKFQLIKYIKLKGYNISKQRHLDPEGLTIFSVDDTTDIRVTWRSPQFQSVYHIQISNTLVEHSSEGSEPVLTAWNNLQPDMIHLFDQLQKDYPTRLSTPRRWYKNGPYAYGISQNNKYNVNYVGPKNRIEELKKQSKECATIYIGWYNTIMESYRKIMNVPIQEFPSLFRKELDYLESEFKQVHIYDMYPFSISDRTCQIYK